MLELKNITKKYSDGTLALDGVSLSIPREHIFAILGTSGAGKTTLLQCLGRFLSPSTGEILLNGRDIQQIPTRDFRRAVGIVFQQLHLFPHLTIMENLLLAPKIVLGEQESAATKRADEVLEQLGITDLAQNYPSAISGGQAQRVAIGRALLLEPEYLLLDEPTSALDVNTTREFASWLLTLKFKTTFVIVTHDLDFARAAAEHAVLMEHGRVTAHGTVDQVAKSFHENRELREVSPTI